MNVNIIAGLLAFLIWSSFSTWYYVNHIWENPSNSDIETTEISKPEVPSDNSMDTTTMEPEVIPEPVITEVTAHFSFERNSIQLLRPQIFSVFLDSVQTTSPTNLALEITGHTCDQGKEQYNLDLSNKRAALIQERIKKAFPNSEIEIDFKGESVPLYPNNSEENRSKNRRVTIKVRSES